MYAFKRLLKIGDFEVPAWWECQWRRIGCGEEDCPMCGTITRDRKKHLACGEDPDSWESAFQDVGDRLMETLTLVRRHAAEMGITLEEMDQSEYESSPDPEEFSLCREARSWREFVDEIIDKAAQLHEPWVSSETGRDISWYALSIQAKTGRLLSDRWHLDRGEEHMDVEYTYTRYILSEITTIVEDALAEAIVESRLSVDLQQALKRLRTLKTEIFTA